MKNRMKYIKGKGKLMMLIYKINSLYIKLRKQKVITKEIQMSFKNLRRLSKFKDKTVKIKREN